MCQLLGMNCNVPTDIIFSFKGFQKRGGIVDNHVDGFGIAFFEDKGVRIYHDNNACASSPLAELINSYPIRSKNVISHIRKATQGKVTMENTHPFMRELWGEYWIFAHNGNLKNFPNYNNTFFNNVGNTDSEKAFCYILENIRKKYHQKPSDEEIFNYVNLLAKEINQYGVFNFILSNGKIMIVHASTLLFYIIRKAPFGVAKLYDDDLSIDFSKVTTPKDKVAVITTLPLTNNEHWEQLALNEMLMFKEGDILFRDVPDVPHYISKEEGIRLAKLSCS